MDSKINKMIANDIKRTKKQQSIINKAVIITYILLLSTIFFDIAMYILHDASLFALGWFAGLNLFLLSTWVSAWIHRWLKLVIIVDFTKNKKLINDIQVQFQQAGYMTRIISGYVKSKNRVIGRTITLTDFFLIVHDNEELTKNQKYLLNRIHKRGKRISWYNTPKEFNYAPIKIPSINIDFFTYYMVWVATFIALELFYDLYNNDFNSIRNLQYSTIGYIMHMSISFIFSIFIVYLNRYKLTMSSIKKSRQYYNAKRIQKPFHYIKPKRFR